MRLNKASQKLSTDERLVLFNVSAIFLPCFACIVTIVLSTIYILCNHEKRKLIFCFPHKEWLLVWAAATVVTGIIYRNFPGTLLFLLLLFYIIYAIYCLSVMTDKLCERVIRYAVVFSIAASLIATIQRIILHGRVPSTFFNANYYGFICELVVVICVYAITGYKSFRWLYAAGILANGFGIWLAGCYFAWLAAISGILILFLCQKKFGPLFISIGIMAAYGGAVIFYPRLLPQTKDIAENLNNRILIWKMSFGAFMKHPLFGEGFLSFMFISSGLDKPLRSHAHNLVLDILLNYGIVGTLLLGTFFVFFLSRLIKKLRWNPICALTLAICVATLIHGFIDIPVMGFQTGVFFLLLLTLTGSGTTTAVQKKNP